MTDKVAFLTDHGCDSPCPALNPCKSDYCEVESTWLGRRRQRQLWTRQLNRALWPPSRCAQPVDKMGWLAAAHIALKRVWAASAAYRTTYLANVMHWCWHPAALCKPPVGNKLWHPSSYHPPTVDVKACHKASPCFPAHGLHRAKHKSPAAALWATLYHTWQGSAADSLKQMCMRSHSLLHACLGAGPGAHEHLCGAPAVHCARMRQDCGVVSGSCG